MSNVNGGKESEEMKKGEVGKERSSKGKVNLSFLPSSRTTQLYMVLYEPGTCTYSTSIHASLTKTPHAYVPFAFLSRKAAWTCVTIIRREASWRWYDAEKIKLKTYFKNNKMDGGRGDIGRQASWDFALSQLKNRRRLAEDNSGLTGLRILPCPIRGRPADYRMFTTWVQEAGDGTAFPEASFSTFDEAHALASHHTLSLLIDRLMCPPLFAKDEVRSMLQECRDSVLPDHVTAVEDARVHEFDVKSRFMKIAICVLRARHNVDLFAEAEIHGIRACVIQLEISLNAKTAAEQWMRTVRTATQ